MGPPELCKSLESHLFLLTVVRFCRDGGWMLGGGGGGRAGGSKELSEATVESEGLHYTAITHGY